MQADSRDGGARVGRRDHQTAQFHPILLWVAEASRESRSIAAAARRAADTRHG